MCGWLAFEVFEAAEENWELGLTGISRGRRLTSEMELTGDDFIAFQ